MQTRLASFIEAWLNVVIGFLVAVGANLVILPHFGYEVSTRDAFSMGYLFTVVSVIRSYTLRRIFNAMLRRSHG